MVIYTPGSIVFFTLTPENPTKQRPPGLARVLLSMDNLTETLDPSRLPGVVMKKVIQPLAWFVVLTSILAVASGVSLGLV
jgi:hypothetical protein